MAWPELVPGAGVGVDGRRRVHVVAHHQHRAAHETPRGEVRQRHHAALAVAHLELLDRRPGRWRKTFLGLDVHLPGAAELVEVVDVVRPQVGLQRRPHVVDRHAAVLGLDAVDDQLQPGRVGPEAGEQPFEPRVGARRRPPPRPRSSAGPAGRCRRGSCRMILKPPAVPRPSTGGAPKMFTIAFGHFLLQLVLKRAAMASADSAASRPLVEVVEHQIKRAEIGRIGVEQDRLSGDGDGVLDALACRRAISSICCTTSSVRATEAASGSCTLTSR